MARGWESKSVESQQEESLREPSHRGLNLSPEERARRERLDSLTLSRTRTLEQLERATSDAHRRMLKRTLLALERDMADLES
ncbi:MAG TPA: hypothetical protein VM936_22735 [Pyrinomonadaceae bacterium]|nr:hypothetical protein [Pyrinomonadaceae bacterium]